ncbi:hypothetical protein JCM10450v2_006639 [Rhodotorula kratochvilovae]
MPLRRGGSSKQVKENQPKKRKPETKPEPPSRRKAPTASGSAASGGKKGKERVVLDSDSDGDISDSAGDPPESDLSEDVKLDFGDAPEESANVVHAALEGFIRRAVEKDISGEEATTYFVWWTTAQALEGTHNSLHFFFDHGRDNVKTSYGGMCFLYVMHTAPHLRPMYQSCYQSYKKGTLASWITKPEDVMLNIPMGVVLVGCVYILNGFLAYVGFTKRAGQAREPEHEESCVSKKMAAAREALPWAQWKNKAVYIAPAAVADEFPSFLLAWIEHLVMTALHATKLGLNTFPLKLLAAAVLDEIAPRTGAIDTVTGFRARISNGTHINHYLFEQHYDEWHAIAPVASSTMWSLFVGYTWAWHFRDILRAEGAPPTCWASGAYPPSLNPDSAAGKAERARKKEQRTQLGKLEGWEEGTSGGNRSGKSRARGQGISPKLAEGDQGFAGNSAKKLFGFMGGV